jgi:hypothetical protein
VTADRNNPGSHDDENTPRDPGVRDGDTRNLPAQDGAPTAQTPTGAYGAPAAYGPYGPGGTGWNAPGWHTPTAEQPRPGRYAKLTRATRGKPFQVAAAAIIGAVIGGGAVAVVDTIGDRHRAGHAFSRMNDHRTQPGEDFGRRLEERGDDERGNGEPRGFRGGTDQWIPGDGFRMPDHCEVTQDGFRCTAPTSAPSPF